MAVMLETASEPFYKRARSTEYVVSLVHPDGVDTVDEESAEVYCVSQNMRKLTDPCVAERVCLIADSEAKGIPRVKQTSVENYIMNEYNNIYNMYIVCFEAFKLLDQGFTDILKSTGGLKEHETFVKEFRQAARTVARTQNISIPKGKLWVDYLSFGGFAQAIKNLYDCKVINEADKKQVASLKQYAEDVFRDILHDGLEFLEEEAQDLPQHFVDLEAIKMLPLTEIVTQWVSCYNFRAKRNSHGHPFSASSPTELRKASLKFYEKCLNHGITEGFRTVAQLGKLKLDIQEKKLVQHSKLKTSSITVSDVLNQDESDSDIEEYLD